MAKRSKFLRKIYKHISLSSRRGISFSLSSFSRRSIFVESLSIVVEIVEILEFIAYNVVHFVVVGLPVVVVVNSDFLFPLDFVCSPCFFERIDEATEVTSTLVNLIEVFLVSVNFQL